MPPPLNNLDIIKTYFHHHYRVIFWPQIGDEKGPHEPGWTTHQYTQAEYHNGDRVGIITGTPVTDNQYLHDVDIDWADGCLIAQALLPSTTFIFGRSSKKVSHCFYILPEPVASIRYEDIDKSCLIELRGTKTNGELGMQTMVPPSVWTKNGSVEPLRFVSFGEPSYVDNVEVFKRRVMLSAIGMLLAKHLGTNGFGHEPRLAWAGYLLRANVTADELITMGEAISAVCNNTEVKDVRQAVKSTVEALTNTQKKTKGGPALAKLIGKNGRAIITLINEWLGREDDFYRVEGKIVVNNQQNIRRALTLLGKELSYNQFSGKLMDADEPMEDRQMEDAWLRIDREFHFRPSKEFFEVVMRDVAYENSFHPVKQYLDRIVWDHAPRVDAWLVECAGAPDTPYIRAVSAIVLIAAVRRIRQPGCKFDELLVLESAVQGLNKSTALRLLCPHDEWFSDDLPLNVDGKRVIESTAGKWIIEASELVGRKADREHLKSMLSRQVDHARLSYARLPMSKPREFIIIGTTNSDDYLSDPSGARRFWPVPITAFNIQKLGVCRDQLWAEAATREAIGESIRLPEALWPVAGEQQKRRHEGHAFEDVVRETLLSMEPDGLGKRRIISDALWEALRIELKDRPRMYKSLAEIMTRFGFKRTTIRVEGKTNPVSGYISITPNDPDLDAVSDDREVGSDDVDYLVKKSEDPPF